MIVQEDNVRRNLWRLGRIERLITGSSGIVGGAAVKIGERDKASTVIERPIQKLYPHHQPTPCNQEESSIARRLPRRRAVVRRGGEDRTFKKEH